MMGPTSLDALARQAGSLQGVRRPDLDCGDGVIVTTRNSSYVIISLGNGKFRVSGGWFDRNGASPAVTTINGCTWGGSALKPDLIASPGLFLEFGNRVLTTRIRAVRVMRARESQTVH